MRNTGRAGGKVLRVVLVIGMVVLVALIAALVLGGRSRLGRSAARAGGAVAGQPGAGGKPSNDNGLTIINFRQQVLSEQTGELQALITGAQAVREGDKGYQIELPRVESYPSKTLSGGQEEGSFGEVDLTAKQAYFDQQKSVVDMYKSVKAIGSDFDMSAEQVTYLVTERRSKTAVPVEIHRYRVGPNQKKELAMTITGTGMDIDLTLRRIIVLAKVKAILPNVSEDFMAGGTPQEAGRSQQVVITSDGAMTYENAARKATFEKNAVAVTGEKTLRGETLVALLGKNEGAESLQVSSIKADGDVEFKFGTETAYGDSLVWDNVTQAGVVTGKTARLVTSDLVITGAKLTFFRLNSRFQVDGPGKLVWTPAQAKGGKASSKKPAPGLLAPGEPLDVVWAGGMSYDSRDMNAVFSKEVKAVQKSGTLTSDSLEVQFANEDRSIKRVLARENVHLVQSVENMRRSVDCDRADWDAASGIAKFTAAQGKQATVLMGEEKLVSSDVVFEPNKDLLYCKAGGTLDMPGGRAEGGSAPEPTKVRWDKSMQYSRATPRVAEFEGAVEVNRPRQVMKGDSVRVDFDEKQSPVKITARKNALLEVLPAQDAKPDEAPKPAAGGSKEKTPVAASLTQAPEHWRLNADVIVGHPQDDMLQSEGQGLLELFHKDGPGDSVRYRKSMMIDFRKSVSEFKGDVDARFSGSVIRCGLLRLEFDDKNELRHMYCEDDVQFTSAGEGAWKLSGKSSEAVFAAGSVLSQVISRGDVTVEDAERTVKSQLLTLFFAEGKDGKGSSLSRAVAKKDVSVHYAGDKKIDASADDLLWDVESGLYTLIGSPAWLKQSGFGAKGEKIFIDRKTGRLVVPAGQKPAATTIEGGP